MDRLLRKAEEIEGYEVGSFDRNNFADVIEAIHIIQEDMGILGTTAKEANDTLIGSFSQLKASFDNFLSGTGSLAQVMENVGIFSGNLMRIISEAFPQILADFTANLPLIVQTGSELIIQLILGIAQTIPQLVPAIVEAVLTIVDTLLDNIDMLVDAGIELIIGLAMGLIEALPKLIEKAPVIIDKLVNAIIRNFPKIVRAGGELLGKLVVGIIGSISKLIEVAPKLIGTLKNGLINGLNEMRNVGKNLVQGLWNGIAGMGDWLRSQVRGFAHNVVQNMKNALGIHSPSKVMQEQVGQWIPKGIAVGIDANTDSALKSIDLMNDEIMSKMNRAVAIETAKSNFGGMSQSVSEILNANSVIKVENYNTLELDGEKIYENQKVIQKNKNLQYGFGGAF